MTNLLSSAAKKGSVVTQILTNNNGIKKTIRGVKTDTIEQGEFTKFEVMDGRMIFVKTDNTWIVEVFGET